MRKTPEQNNPPGEHTNDSSLLDRIEGRLGRQENLAIDVHLKDCPRCRKRAKELEAVVTPLLRRSLVTTPSWLRNWSEDLPQSHPRRVARATSRLLRLTFDSWALKLAGARSVASGVRRLVFRSGPVDLDLQIETGPAGRLRLRGQVLDGSIPGGRTFAAGQVEVRSGRRSAGTSPLGRRGDFVLADLAPGTYEVRITARGLLCRTKIEV
jgi:anti-sigma factor RsiW